MKPSRLTQSVLSALLFALLFTTGCPPTPYSRSVQDVQRGMLVSYTDRRAFVDVWGAPDITRIIKGERVLAEWSTAFGASSGIVRADRFYDVWEYRSRETILIFDGYYLIYWITDKTTHELRSGPNAAPNRNQNESSH